MIEDKTQEVKASNENKHNLLYFENNTMKGLYESLEKWQKTNVKRLLSITIQKDKENFCCIALSNPTEVIICQGEGRDQANVITGSLEVTVVDYS